MNNLFDNITGYEFTINKDGDMILIKHGEEFKLADCQVVLNNMIREEN